jgi:hypothetical protein
MMTEGTYELGNCTITDSDGQSGLNIPRVNTFVMNQWNTPLPWTAASTSSLVNHRESQRPVLSLEHVAVKAGWMTEDARLLGPHQPKL